MLLLSSQAKTQTFTHYKGIAATQIDLTCHTPIHSTTFASDKLVSSKITPSKDTFLGTTYSYSFRQSLYKGQMAKGASPTDPTVLARCQVYASYKGLTCSQGYEHCLVPRALKKFVDFVRHSSVASVHHLFIQGLFNRKKSSCLVSS